MQQCFPFPCGIAHFAATVLLRTTNDQAHAKTAPNQSKNTSQGIMKKRKQLSI